VQILITGRHLQLSDEMQRYVREKAGKLPRYYERLNSIEVVIAQHAGHFEVEMLVSADHRQSFVGRESHQDVFAAVDLLMDKMERQLTRHKEKVRNRKGRQSADGSGPAPQARGKDRLRPLRPPAGPDAEVTESDEADRAGM